MNAYAQPSVFPDPVHLHVHVAIHVRCVYGDLLVQVEACPVLHWDGQGQPLAAVPLPVSSGSLLSDWPLHNSRFTRRCYSLSFTCKLAIVYIPLSLCATEKKELPCFYKHMCRFWSMWTLRDSGSFYHTMHLLHRCAPVIDAEVLANMKMKQFVGHAPKPAHLCRNQVPYDLRRESRASVPESPMMRGIIIQTTHLRSFML